jgi:DNA segregation ATPase FtsK/SpoIIIE-like protein
LPHVDKFVTEAGDADGLTTEVLKEINRREKEVKGHAKNIDGWNQLQSRHKDKQWPRILLIIDEYAQLKGQKANRALENLTMIFAKGGAFGIHCIVATQVPNRDVIDSLVKNNITVRAAFNSASYAHSMNMLDNGDAFGLGNRGRFVFSLHGDKTLVQAPLIEDKDEQSLVAEVKAYWSEAQDIVGDFDYKNLLRYAIDNMNYQIPMRKVAQAFSGQVSRFGVETYLAKIEGQTVNVDGKDYMVIAGNNRTPRRLMPLFSLPQELASSGQPPTELIEMGDA